MLLSLEPQANQGAYNGIRDLCLLLTLGISQVQMQSLADYDSGAYHPAVSFGPQGYSGSVLFQLLS